MFEPEHVDTDCPKCSRRKIYFDREIGYYCMYCGHELNEDEIIILTEQLAQAAQPQPAAPDKSPKQPVTEIKEIPTRKKKKPDHVHNNKTTP